VAALLASLSVFWLLNCIAGTIFTAQENSSCCALAGSPEVMEFFGTLKDVAIPALPFSGDISPRRRPLFFVFQLLVWMRFLASANAARESVRSLPASLWQCLSFRISIMGQPRHMADVHRCALVLFSTFRLAEDHSGVMMIAARQPCARALRYLLSQEPRR